VLCVDETRRDMSRNRGGEIGVPMTIQPQEGEKGRTTKTLACMSRRKKTGVAGEQERDNRAHLCEYR